MTYPWAKEPYTVHSTPFELVPAVVSVDVSGSDVRAWLQAPARGYRMVAQGGAVRGQNPLHGDTLTLTLTRGDGSTATEVVAGVRDGRATRADGVVDADVVTVTVTDAWGNTGRWTRPE